MENKKTKKVMIMPSSGNGVFVLPDQLREDINQLDSIMRSLRTEIDLMQAKFQAKGAEYQGAEATIYAFFKADALGRGLNMKGKRIELLGDFKYRLVEVNVQDALPPAPPLVQRDGSGE